jgi:hypothetical protein
MDGHLDEAKLELNQTHFPKLQKTALGTWRKT